MAQYDFWAQSVNTDEPRDPEIIPDEHSQPEIDAAVIGHSPAREPNGFGSSDLGHRGGERRIADA